MHVLVRYKIFILLCWYYERIIYVSSTLVGRKPASRDYTPQNFRYFTLIYILSFCMVHKFRHMQICNQSKVSLISSSRNWLFLTWIRDLVNDTTPFEISPQNHVSLSWFISLNWYILNFKHNSFGPQAKTIKNTPLDN